MFDYKVWYWKLCIDIIDVIVIVRKKILVKSVCSELIFVYME